MIMNLYCDDLEVEILARENALEVDILSADIMSELSFFNESVFMESEENTSVLKKVADKISEIVGKIVSFIQGIFTSLHLGAGEELKASDYLNSEDVKIKMSAKAEQIQKELEDEILAGRKIVNSVSKATGIDPHIVDSLSQKAQSFVLSEGGRIVGIAATTVIANKLSKTILGGKKLMKDIDETSKKIAKEERKRDERHERKLKESGHGTLLQLTKLTNVISNTTRKATGLYYSTVNELDKYKKK